MSRTAVYDCFRDGRVRMDLVLLEDLGRVLGLEEEAAHQWMEICFGVQNGLASGRIVLVDRDPRRTGRFVGRETELAAVRNVRELVTISGVGGIGKTQLALQVADERTRAGQATGLLFVALQSDDNEPNAADPAAVRGELLRLMEVGRNALGRSEAEQSQTIRERLADQRMTLVLDDAASADQVRAIVGSGVTESLVLVTSRLALTGLPGKRLALGPLDEDAAVKLLDVPVPASPSEDIAASELVQLLGGHPLAVELAARRLAETPGWTLADHLAALRDQHELLHLPHPVAASLELSLRVLDRRAGLVLRLLADQPCTYLPLSALRALLPDQGAADGSPSVDESINRLAAAHLIGGTPQALELHQLVRVAARARGLREDPPALRSAARCRLLEHYLEAATWAIAQVGMLPYVETSLSVSQDQERDPWNWLARERGNLMRLADPRHTTPLPEATVRLSWLLGRYFEAQGFYADAEVLHRWGVAAAGQLDDPLAEVASRGFLAGALARLGRSDEALQESGRVLARAEVETSAEALATARNVKGIVAVQRGDLEVALEEFRAALEVVDTGRTVRSRAGLLGNIGAVLTYLGRTAEAVTYHRRALDQALADDDPGYASAALTNLVDSHLENQSPGLALETAQQACELAERFGTTVAASRSNLGVALTAVGRFDEARAAHRSALAAAHETKDPDVTAAVYVNLGDTERASGDIPAARSAYLSALEVVAQSDGWEAGRAQAGLAACDTSAERR